MNKNQFVTIVRKTLLLHIVCILCLRFVAYAQTGNDSLRNNITNAATDSLKVEALYEYMKANLNNNTSDFGPYIKQMTYLSKKIHFKWGLSTAYILGLSYYKNQGEFEKSLLYADSAMSVTISDTAQDMQRNMGHIHLNRGNLYYNIGDYENAVKDYFEAESFYKKVHHKQLASVYSNIGNCFMALANDQKALEYSKKAVETAKEFDDDRLLATDIMNLATEYMNLNDYASSDSLLHVVWTVVEKLDNNKSFHVYYYNKGDVEAYYKKDTAKALEYFQQSYYYAKLNEDVSQQGKALDRIISFQLDIQSKDAKTNIDKLYALADENGMDDERASALDYYSTWYSSTGDYKKAYEYEKRYRIAIDSINSNEVKEKADMMEVRFRVAAKEQEIDQLRSRQQIQQLDLDRKNMLNYILMGSALVLLLISLLIYRNYKSKQKLQQAKIDDLEKEKQLMATEAVLKGEEQERTRLAKDLHDGLGGMLSGIKYSLSNMKENLIMTPENARAFERSIDMLDSSIKEMRRVAHNMMPEILLKYGLDVALREFCAEIDRSSVIHTTYQSIGVDKAVIDQITAVTIYRVVQELVNNTIKHASAQNVLVQVHIAEKMLTVTVEDDGKGFDTAALERSPGMGWSNIKSRVAFLHGKIDVNSEPHKGTSTLIEINIS